MANTSNNNKNQQYDKREANDRSGKQRKRSSKSSKRNRGYQSRKDSSAKRINADNERESKFIKQYDKDGMRPKTSDGANDISWYSRNPELLKSAASFPFGSVLGMALWNNGPFYVPGVMVIKFTFAFGGPMTNRYYNGIDFSGTWYPEALNQAGKSSYSFLVHANSRNYNYEYQDLSIIQLAGMQVFCAITHMIRAYAIAKTYAEKSIYKPEAYLTAMGFDPSEIRNNLGQMWFDINSLIAQTSQIWIPSEAPLLKRWIWMCSSIFTDANSALSQNYIFVPRLFLQYNETSVNTGGSLEPASFRMPDTTYATLSTDITNPWSNWVAMVQHMIDRLVNSEDRGIMFGDILNAYGADRIFAMPPVPVDTRIEPVYQPEVLTQIENLTVTHSYCVGVRQDTGGLFPLMSYPKALARTAVQGIAPRKPVLNFHQLTQPTPEQIVVATRLTAANTMSWGITAAKPYKINGTVGKESASTVTLQDGTGNYLVPMAYGSELVSRIMFITKTPGVNEGWSLVDYPYDDSYPSGEWAPMNKSGAVPASYTSFDWAPFVYTFESVEIGQLDTEGAVLGNYIYDVAGDFDNYTTLDDVELSKLHNMALMSEFGLPII